MSQRDSGPIPNRWLNCPRKAAGLIAEKFLAFKTPLGPHFNDKVPVENRFTPSILFLNLRDLKIKLGLWIDLTNTSRFYDKNEIEKNGCKYIKMACRGHGETPTREQTRHFIDTVNNFMNQNPDDMIGVHCTHGFNRTGFLIVSFMVEEMDFSLDAALHQFAVKREPGIYKQDYLDELYKRYEDSADFPPTAPSRPQWCNEDEEEYDDDELQANSSHASHSSHSSHSEANSSFKHSRGRGKKGHMKPKEFIPPLHGVNFYDNEDDVLSIQQKAKNFCKWTGKGFPGCQPVSMTVENISLLQLKPYRVSWKADGVRYMMLIDGKDRVFMLDRDFSIFKVDGLIFLHNKTMKHLTDTLLDGEMVIDKEDGEEKNRYLCYDIIRFENQNVGRESFYPVRLMCIEKEIMNPRNRAIASGMISKGPFSVHLKEFWDLSMTHYLLDEKFAKKLCHEPDGLIFQPSKEGYVAGACDEVLKWKPSDMNSVDFRLKITTESGLGMLPKKIGLLYVSREKNPISNIKLTKQMKHLNNKIIECKFENGQWVFMRERTDKSFPNSLSTAMAVWESISNPVTKEYLLDFINKRSFHDDSEMPPPPKRSRV
ncbi:PREDICTED: mRNA-capping enzyme [Papilio xuthus]|uniref:mRNA-capping enzyme n=1 Tax=Papilio xuthus TaxID=66420 RepID=A0A194Q0P7_PAPXU|nr:PREDICTED: mRNA-capping enzyme [Papilio xuthus]KPI98564.1 mRNA-capping enzyme [Papilio xuthus]